MWFLNKICCIFLLVIALGRLYDNCERTYKGSKIILNKTCDWSEWLSWDCSCCKTSLERPFAVRKRAICCRETVNLSACILDCNYEEDSDKMYGNCTRDLCGDMSRDPTCGDSNLPAGIILLTLPTKETPTTKSSSSTPVSTTSTSSTPPATTSVLTTILQTTTTFVTSLTKGSLSTALVSTLLPPNIYTSRGIELTNSTVSNTNSSITSIVYKASLAASSTISRDSSHSDSLTRLSTLSHDSLTTKTDNGTFSSGSAKNDNVTYTVQNEQTSTDRSTNETSALTYKSGLKETSSHLGTILGSVLGSLLALGAVGGIIYFLKRRERAKRETSVHPDIDHHSTECSPELDPETV